MKILITGASGGIGSVIAEMFIGGGHSVVGMDVLPPVIIDENYDHIVHDICDTDYPEIEEIEVLINCAKVQTQTEYDIAVNLTATINITEFYAFQDGIKSVVTITPGSGHAGIGSPYYAASKGGLAAYTGSLAARLAPYGATANCLCPGEVMSDPAEIAQWTYFIACINKTMTGENLLLDNVAAVGADLTWKN